MLYQQFENNVLQNVVYSKTVSLSPLIVFIAALIGAALGGIVGVLIAIPLTSAGWVLARDLIALRRERHAQREGGPTPWSNVPRQTARPRRGRSRPARTEPVRHAGRGRGTQEGRGRDSGPGPVRSGGAVSLRRSSLRVTGGRALRRPERPTSPPGVTRT